MRDRIRAWRGRRASVGNQAPPAASESLPDQLERLASMRDRGAITPADYEAAKARLLAHPS
jgi:hypothetical protein